MARLDGKVAVITGAASGMGAATAHLFASEGARVLVTDMDNEKGQHVAAELGDSGDFFHVCLLYTSPSPRDATLSRMPSSA